MVVEKKRFTVYGLVPLNTTTKKRVKRTRFYIGYTNRLCNRLRNHLLTTGTRGAWKTRKSVLKYGAVVPHFFVTGFIKSTHALSFETALDKHKLPKRESSKIPKSIRRLIRIMNKKTWSVKKKIPDAKILPDLTIHWIRPEYKPNPGEYCMDFPSNVHHVYHDNYTKIDEAIIKIKTDKTMTKLQAKDLLQQTLNC